MSIFSLHGGGEIDQFSKEVGWLAYALSVWKDELIMIGEYFLLTVEEQFDTDGSRSGGWMPLSPMTVALKGHDTILVDTGELRDSWDYPFTGINEITIRSEDPNIEKVKAAQFGFVHNWTGQYIEPRPMLVVLPEDLDAIDELFVGSVDRKLGLVFTS